MSEVDRGASGPGEWPGWAGRVTRWPSRVSRSSGPGGPGDLSRQAGRVARARRASGSAGPGRWRSLHRASRRELIEICRRERCDANEWDAVSGA